MELLGGEYCGTAETTLERADQLVGEHAFIMHETATKLLNKAMISDNCR